jgi:hypothetical protein
MRKNLKFNDTYKIFEKETANSFHATLSCTKSAETFGENWLRQLMWMHRRPAAFAVKNRR